MPSHELGFDEILDAVRKLSSEVRLRLFKTLGLNVAVPPEGDRPPPEVGEEFHCARCGAMLPAGAPPDKCPGCGAPHEQFVLEAED